MNVDADVLVVGAGPVGLAAAIEARLAGLSVIVVDSREDPIDKACGEGLMPGALPHLARWSVDPVGRDLAGVRYCAGSRAVEHRFRVGPGRGVRRVVLQEALAVRARELGVERVSQRVTSIDHTESSVGAAGVTARWLLACDGLHSTVRRLAGLEARASRTRRFGVREHVAVAPWTDLVEVHWTPIAELYVTPVDDATVGVAVLAVQGVTFEEALQSAPILRSRLAEMPRVSERRGAGPFGVRARRPSRGRILLVGDSSGYVDALTGEGLRLGFEQARAAVATVQGGPAYDPEWRRVTRTFRALTRGLVWAAASPVRGAIVPTATALPALYGNVVERLAR